MRAAVLCVILAVSISLPVVAPAQPEVTVLTDDDTYQLGDTIEVLLAADNYDEATTVAVYVGLLTPEGRIYTAQPDGWSAALKPWIPEIEVPAGFWLNPTLYWRFDLPCPMPPIQKLGEYRFASVLTYPGTFKWISTPSFAPFVVGYPHRPDVHVDAEHGDDSSDGSEEAPWKTITHAIAWVNGSEGQPVTIHVAAGTYAASTNGETFPLNMKSWVSLSGESADTTILDAEGAAYLVIYCYNASGFTVEGFTITGGNADGAWPDDSGGGIYCWAGYPIIRHNVISGNAAAYRGAGISCYFCSPTITNNTIEGNLAEYGGGIFCDYSSPMIQDNTVLNNSAEYGGGIYCWYESSPTILSNVIEANSGDGICCSEGCSPTITSNTIRDNSGGGIVCFSKSSSIIDGNLIEDNSGGGISCWRSSPTITNNTVMGNSYYNGGGIYCRDGSSPTIQGNSIAANRARYGGGIYCDESSPTISDNMIAGNVSYDVGGALLCEYSLPTVVNNTITGNLASRGGGIHCTYGSSPMIVDCLIWGNGDDLCLSASSQVICCDIEDGDWEGQNGNISEDPIFVSGPFGDYYLRPDSPCINAGSQSASAAGLSDRTTQADGTPDAGTVDMGYHYPVP